MYVGTSNVGPWQFSQGKWWPLGRSESTLTRQVLALAVSPDGTVYSSFGGVVGAYRLDGGTWSSLPPIGSQQTPSLMTCDANGVLTAATNGLGMSTSSQVWQFKNGSWIQIANSKMGVAKYIIGHLTISPYGDIVAASYNGLWKYHNGSWSKYGNAKAPFDAVSSIAFSPKGQPFVAAYSSFNDPEAPSGVWTMVNGSWAKVGDLSASIANVEGQLAVLPNGTLVCASGEGGGVWQYSTGKWSMILGQNSPLMGFEAHKVMFDQSGNLYLLSSYPGIVLKFSDGQWTDLTAKHPWSGDISYTAMCLNGEQLLLGLDMVLPGFGNGQGLGVWEQHNGTWTQLGGKDAAINSLSVLSLQAVGHGDFIAGTTQGVWEYRLGAWVRLGRNNLLNNQAVPYIVNHNGTFIAAGYSNSVWKYEGSNWRVLTKLPNGLGIEGISITNDGRVLMDALNSIWQYSAGTLQRLGGQVPGQAEGQVFVLPDGNLGVSSDNWLDEFSQKQWTPMFTGILSQAGSTGVHDMVACSSGLDGTWLYGSEQSVSRLTGGKTAPAQVSFVGDPMKGTTYVSATMQVYQNGQPTISMNTIYDGDVLVSLNDAIRLIQSMGISITQHGVKGTELYLDPPPGIGVGSTSQDYILADQTVIPYYSVIVPRTDGSSMTYIPMTALLAALEDSGLDSELGKKISITWTSSEIDVDTSQS